MRLSAKLIRLSLLPFVFMGETSTSTSAEAGQYLDSDSVPPTCDGCFCVVSDGEECPIDKMPEMEFSFTDKLKAMVWDNPITLSCHPYTDENCTITDVDGNSVDVDSFGPDAVCGMIYHMDGSSGCATTYSTKTFSSVADLEAASDEGYMLTHYGACGACSSTQDLAVYINNQFESFGFSCGLRSAFSEKAGLECFEDVGFTTSCAAVWLYNALHTGETCLCDCAPYLDQPPNLDALSCPWNDCMQCDEQNSGAIFRKSAGRSRAGSGLLSYIVSNCSDLHFDVAPLDPCPDMMMTSSIGDPTSTKSTTSSVASVLGESSRRFFSSVSTRIQISIVTLYCRFRQMIS